MRKLIVRWLLYAMRKMSQIPAPVRNPSPRDSSCLHSSHQASRSR